MKILHSSDFHIGRTFHATSTLDHLRQVLAALVSLAVQQSVDVLVVSGDIFDTSTPAADHYAVLTETLTALHSEGIAVVMTSGNHDSATRLGFQSQWASQAGIHILTEHDAYSRPVELNDEFGPVLFYGIPYLEPSLIRHLHPEVELRSQQQALSMAMDAVRADLASRASDTSPVRSVAMAHCFVVGGEASDVERDITAGGLDYVSLSTFDGPDYVALGHIHGRAVFSERVRYSGAPLHYSFSEANKPRGVWLIDLGATGLGAVEWHDLPIPRPLSVVTGTLNDLITQSEYNSAEQHWVSAILTDQQRPLDAMAKLRERFAYCVTLEFQPDTSADHGTATYAQRVQSQSDPTLIAGFLEYVRNGVGQTDYERECIADALAQVGETEAKR
ncbi:exonuclease SbcCD subunit D [Lysinibacter cavernae]|uniref:Nuclease SbcCD subunit D n=1 Tax=Lysinibacter cavernae TaxID=1640652 RepID=A0A7X5TUM8_9MICO|nr:exonuclease SbcCD subunit D [Lysinibacter cavernae]NIH54729.1 exonuclease SbcD [Lysinibacter cavernae]